jgi:hypothetical protein
MNTHTINIGNLFSEKGETAMPTTGIFHCQLAVLSVTTNNSDFCLTKELGHSIDRIPSLRLWMGNLGL